MIAESIKRKKEGFEGQKAVIIPRKILADQCKNNSIVNSLYITDVGYYPKAKFHYRKRLHGADQHILIYCIEGTGSVQISKNEYAIKPGDFFIVPKNVAHTYASNEINPWTIYWVHFKGIVADEIVALAQKNLEGHKGFIHYNDARIDLFKNIYNELERGYSTDNLIHVNMMFWHYLSTFIFGDKLNTAGKLSKSDIIDKSIDFMRSMIDQVINLDDMAKKVNLSPSHFSALFKKKTGFSPIEYFNHLKVQKACQYLLFSDFRIKEIAYQVGVDDPYYFSRLFTKVMGMSPNEYREKKVH